MSGRSRGLVMLLLVSALAFPTGLADHAPSADEVIEEPVAPPFTRASSGCAGDQLAACLATADPADGRLLLSLTPATHSHLAPCVANAPRCPVGEARTCFGPPFPPDEWCPVEPVTNALDHLLYDAGRYVGQAEDEAHDLIGTGKRAHALVGTDHVLPWPAESVVYTVLLQVGAADALDRRATIAVSARQDECQATGEWRANEGDHKPDLLGLRSVSLELRCPGGAPLGADAVSVSVAIQVETCGDCADHYHFHSYDPAETYHVWVEVEELAARMTRAL